MRVPEGWLRDWVDTSLSIEEIAERLTMAGLEVEEIESAAPPFTGVVVAKILDAQKHPDADRLRVCTVSTGDPTKPLQIVCGAPNAHAGMFVACATDGAVLPGDFRIKQAKMRGVVSQGMLCSSKELGISEESEGIIDLGALSEDTLGQSLREHLGLDQKTLVIKLTPNRADCLSIKGVARELAALIGSPLREPKWSSVLTGINDKIEVQVEPDSQRALCGRFATRVLRGVNPKAPTPAWLRERLEKSGQRSISALVDISNYVMLELGQPTHVFDLDRLKVSSKKISARWAWPGESLHLLNDQQVSLDKSVGVVADDEGPVSMAGIMGGHATAVSDDTQNILVEAAFWWPDAIRGRAQRYRFTTDAGHRFERGVDPGATVQCLERVCQLIAEICGGVAGPLNDQSWAAPLQPIIHLRKARCERVIGRPYSSEQVAEVLRCLGIDFETKEQGNLFIVSPPSHRFDLQIEEDLIEEVARVVGFDTIEARPPKAELKTQTPPEATRSAMEIRDRLVSLGVHEVITYGFMEKGLASRFANSSQLLGLRNPIASHLNVMRPSVVPNLLGILKENRARQEERIRLFEIGRRFRRDEAVSEGAWSVAGVEQDQVLAVLLSGSAQPTQWGVQSVDVDFFDLKGLVEDLFFPVAVTLEPLSESVDWLHPGRSARVLVQGKVVGLMGEVHPQLLQDLDLEGGSAPLVCESLLQPLLHIGLPKVAIPSKLPSVVRDIAWIVPNQVTAGRMTAAVKGGLAAIPEGRWVVSMQLFDLYKGQGLGQGEKSLAFRFVLQDTEKTLEVSEIDAWAKKLVEFVSGQLPARIRG